MVPDIRASAGTGEVERNSMANAKTSCFVDTNVLVYTVDPSEPEKRALAGDLLERVMVSRALILSPQSLNECYRIVTDRRRLMPREDARRFVSALVSFCVAPSGYEVTRQAWRIQDATNYTWWDCMLLSSALLAGAEYFLSEDMQHERRLEGMTILDPFRLDPPHQPF
jgi:predicted nucleic acid-binding protein